MKASVKWTDVVGKELPTPVGVDHFIVVDGFGGASDAFILNIFEDGRRRRCRPGRRWGRRGGGLPGKGSHCGLL